MTWEISISSESWNDIYRALPHIGRGRLVDAIHINDPDSVGKLYNKACDELAEILYEQIEEHRSCSNGGFEIYLDKEGWNRIHWDEIDRINEREDY